MASQSAFICGYTAHTIGHADVESVTVRYVKLMTNTFDNVNSTISVQTSTHLVISKAWKSVQKIVTSI